jgi:hypothetical protein
MSTDLAEQTRRAESSVLCAALQDVKDILSSGKGLDKDKAKIWERSVFANPKVKVLTEDDGDIDTQIQQTVGRLGLCAVVILREAEVASANLPNVIFRGLQVVVEVSEKAITNRGMNGTGITCLEAAEQAAGILHFANLRSGRMVKVASVVKFMSPPQPADNCYHVSLIISAQAHLGFK